jgi:hypothetical protein
MLKTAVASIAFGTVIAFSPVGALAQTTPAASSMHQASAHHRPTGSFKSQQRHRSNMHKHHARAGAEHARKMRQQ